MMIIRIIYYNNDGNNNNNNNYYYCNNNNNNNNNVGLQTHTMQKTLLGDKFWIAEAALCSLRQNFQYDIAVIWDK